MDLWPNTTHVWVRHTDLVTRGPQEDLDAVAQAGAEVARAAEAAQAAEHLAGEGPGCELEL